MALRRRAPQAMALIANSAPDSNSSRGHGANHRASNQEVVLGILVLGAAAVLGITPPSQ